MAEFSRRRIFQLAGAAALLRTRIAGAAQQQPPAPGGPAGSAGQPPVQRALTDPFPVSDQRATVALIHGDDRRKNVHDALMAIDKQLQPKLKAKKYVVIKPNDVNTINQLAATHVDCLRGILDYL
jgi:hypothetical protein